MVKSMKKVRLVSLVFLLIIGCGNDSGGEGTDTDTNTDSETVGDSVIPECVDGEVVFNKAPVLLEKLVFYSEKEFWLFQRICG